MIARNVVFVGLAAVLVILGIALGVTLVVDKSMAAKTSAPYGDGANNTKSFDFTTTSSGDHGNGTSKGHPGNGTTARDDIVGKVSPTKPDDVRADSETTAADPPSEFALHALAIGDWGVSPAGDSCCSKYEKKGEALYRDQQAQSNVAHLLGLSAAQLQPMAVLSHGDNFYWNGLGRKDAEYRIENTFEGIYNQRSLEGIPWFNVLGNHDYGGSAFLCGEADDEWRACESAEEMEKALDGRFEAQSRYKSPNNDRWRLPSHYYKERLSAGGVTVDVFNVDTNAATVHGAEQVCCQCYGYQAGVGKGDPGYVDCNTIHRGHKLCFGGDNDLFDACVAKFKGWTEDSLKQLVRDTAASDANWKIVNSHYSPHYHMDPKMMELWFEALRKGGVQLFINGHTHAESHDVAEFKTHFITNGAGGGIQSESIGKPPPYVKNVETIWSGANAPYGFFELSFAKSWLRARFVTFDGKWKFDEDPARTVKGATSVQHCWLIPHDGSKGRDCDGGSDDKKGH